MAISLHFLVGPARSTNSSQDPHTSPQPTSVQANEPEIARSLPERLLIPKINVNAAIQHLGLTTSGAMDVPNNNRDVGWYQLGANPGDRGSAVIAGHLGPNGSSGIFQDLNELAIGDKVYIRDGLGSMTTFVVWQKKIYDPDAQPTEVFNEQVGIHLNLITCDGKWDFKRQSYGKRLVVFTSIEK